MIIIPILNKKVTLLTGPNFYFNDAIYIDKLTDEEHGAFYRYSSSEFRDSLDIKKTRCIKCQTESVDEKYANNLKTITTFCLNLFSDTPVVTSWAGILSGEKKLKVNQIVEFEAIPSLNRLAATSFAINKSVNRVAFLEFYKLLTDVTDKYPEIYFTLQKYNSALLRSEFIDKLVDSTICFETLIPGNSELIFRLSLFIAYITTEIAEDRERTFEDIKKLYDVRSKIVNGDMK